MEKPFGKTPSQPNVPGKARKPESPTPTVLRLVIALLLTVSLLWVTHYLGVQQDTSNPSSRPPNSDRPPFTKPNEFQWSRITPTTYMDYKPCFGNFQCARLEVPMDYNSTSADGPRVTLAIVRFPAPVSVVDPRYGGPILINPGGPGGSGVTQALNSAERLASIINPDSLESEGKYFDIISWDPRGVNNTAPKLKCFPVSSSYDIWRYQEETEGIGSNEAISKAWARTQALYTPCSENDELASHMNTPPVVADMVEIIERHAEWRSKEAELWMANKEGKSITKEVGRKHHPYAKDAVIERTRWRKGEEKLHYWGFSYGSVLGATFAALQPHRVGHVLLDGIEETGDYYSTAWAMNLKDTDKIIDKFYDYCAAAGSEKCPLNPGTSDPDEIRKILESLMSDIKENPLPVPLSATRGPEIITYSDAMTLIRAGLYKPLDLFPKVATLLADLKGNGSAFADYKQEQHKPSCPLQCKDQASSEQCDPEGAFATGASIACSDGVALQDLSKEAFKNYTVYLNNQSRWLGEYWASITLKCYHWKGKAKWQIAAEDIGGNTSHPILWIGNTLDPVTPLSNAHLMAAKFPGSVVLTQESEGHCSLSNPSLCTAKYVKEYFQTGKLPPPGKVCQTEELPLIGKLTKDILSAEDERLLKAMRGIAKDMESWML